MTELEHAIKHIKTRADAWAVKVVEEALSEWRCIYDLKNRYCPRLDEHGMLKELEQQPKCDKDCEDMTRKEAIEVIKQDIPCEHDTDLIEALEMAIRALEQNESAEEWYKLFVKKLDEQERKSGKCKNCKYFEYDSVAKVYGIPLIVAHEICNKWGDGCKTKEDGYCYLFEPQESEDKE